MNRPIINIDDVELQHSKKGEKFEAKVASIGQLLGARKLGYRLCVVPPGRVAASAGDNTHR